MDSWYRLLNWRYYRRPVFIIGTGRSGTTVLLEALGSHPNLLAAWGEAPLIKDIGRLAEEYTSEDSNGEFLRQTNGMSDRRYLAFLRELAFETTFGADGGLKMRCRATAERLVKYRKASLHLSMTTHWCAKTFPDEQSFRGLLAIYPEARFLWIVRNGLAVVSSRTRFKGFKGLEFEKQCETWADSIEKYDYVQKTDRALELRHEDLVADPDALFARVLEFLQVRQHTGPGRFAKSTLIHPLDQKTQAQADVKQALQDREAVWMQWSNEEKQTFRRICGPAMETMGYAMPF